MENFLSKQALMSESLFQNVTLVTGNIRFSLNKILLLCYVTLVLTDYI